MGEREEERVVGREREEERVVYLDRLCDPVYFGVSRRGILSGKGSFLLFLFGMREGLELESDRERERERKKDRESGREVNGGKEGLTKK